MLVKSIKITCLPKFWSSSIILTNLILRLVGIYMYVLCMYAFADYSINVNCLHLQLLDSSQTLLPADELKKRFEQEGVNVFWWIFVMLNLLHFFDLVNSNVINFYWYAGISLESPAVTSCGTGVTACILALVHLSLYLDEYIDVCCFGKGNG